MPIFGNTDSFSPGSSGGDSLAQRERRRRKRVAYRMDVTSAKGKFAGCVLDLSADGLRMMCTSGFDFSKTDKLRIQVPRWLDLGPTVDVRGHFIWSKSVGETGEVEAGYVFDKLPSKTRAVLGILIERIEEIYGSC